jgi:hypothetical protein
MDPIFSVVVEGVIMSSKEAAIDHLRTAYRSRNLTLFLGAGVSVANGLPTWERLVLAMYFSTINMSQLGSWRPFPNYLFAIAEWHLKRLREPLEITARKLRKYYESGEQFMTELRKTLYAGFRFDESARFLPMDRQQLRGANPTLDSIARLCETAPSESRGVHAVITYNYDSLLEIALGGYPYEVIWKAGPRRTDKLPIYHVHGYVPIGEQEGSRAEELLFTEEQYNRASHDPYSWSNLIQIQSMAGSLGLMVGLSMTDRNMRRLLDAVQKAPVRTQHYALLKEPSWDDPREIELDEINDNALSYYERFTRSGGSLPGTKGERYAQEIRGILRQVEKQDKEQQGYILRQLGVEPIWYQDHAEVAIIINKVREPSPP